MKKLILGLLLLVGFSGWGQQIFGSKDELNNYIFQNSNLTNITDGYFLEFDEDFTPDVQDSFFTGIQNEVRLEQLHTYLKIMEDSDVTSSLEIDSVLFPVMDRIYANNGISPIALPLFICDVQFHHLNEISYNNFSNWSSTNPFPQLNQSDLDYRREFMTGFYADSLKNQNIRIYWNEDTYFSNTDRTIEDVHVIINGDSIRMEQNSIYDLNNHFNSSISSIDISIQFNDGTIENKTNKLFFTNTVEKSNCEETISFMGEEKPWSSLSGLCTWGYDIIDNEYSADFPLLGINFSVLWGCGPTKILNKPYIILTGWGPFTDNNFLNNQNDWPSSIEDAYYSYNQEGFINNLIDAGFDVIIAKLMPPNQSILKNSILIERLIKMVNEEKFSNGSYEENIISGYSAGAMSVRLTLQRMEKEHLLGTNEHHHSKLYFHLMVSMVEQMFHLPCNIL